MQMNKQQQIQSAEHKLKKMGNSIVSSKKKRKTSALSSNEYPSGIATDVNELLETYDLMIKELSDACDKGDSDSKLVVERLSPTMAEVLKCTKEWNSPDILENVITQLVVDTSHEVTIPSDDIFTKLIEAELGCHQEMHMDVHEPPSSSIDLQDPIKHLQTY